jgi:hypothetical protein
VSTFPGVAVSLAVLAAAGILPTLQLVGWRWTTIPLSILSGTLVSAIATTLYVAVGGSLMGWFATLGVALAIASLLAFANDSAKRTDSKPSDGARLDVSSPADRYVRILGAVAVVVATAWCLRGLRTPMVGLDARLFWFLRAGWWLRPQHQALANMHNIGSATHAGYPPLISSTVAVSWWIVGEQSARIAQVLIAIVNGCAAVVAASAVSELGVSVVRRIGGLGRYVPNVEAGSLIRAVPPWVMTRIPLICGVGASLLLVFTFFGVSEPFTTNGYADPLWSVAAAGGVVYLLVAPASRVGCATAAILLAVAAETKAEGAATVVGIIVVFLVRSTFRVRNNRETRSRLIRSAITGGAAIAGIAVWPVLMRLRGVGANVNTSGPRQLAMTRRAQAAVDGVAPHLHVLLLAAALSITAAFIVRGVRSALSIESDLWAWIALIVGTCTILAAYVVGPGNLYYLDLWLQTSAHRVSEFPALAAWWIIGASVVVASAAPAVHLRQPRQLESQPAQESPTSAPQQTPA